MGFLQRGHNVLQWLVSYICTNLACPICHSVMDTTLCTPHPGPPRTLFVRYLYKAYAYLGTSSHADCTEAIQAASKPVHFDDPLHLSVPYNYQASRLRELPDNTFT